MNESESRKTVADIVADIRERAENAMRNGERLVHNEAVANMLTFVADRIEAAVDRERRQYQKLHDCFWDKGAVQCIIRRMRDSRDDLARANPETARELDYYANELIRARCDRAARNTPPRNCDRFKDELDAQLAFLNEVWLISVDRESMLERDRYENWTDEMRARYGQWLLAPAQVQEEGAA